MSARNKPSIIAEIIYLPEFAGLFIATLRICSNKYIDMMTDEIKTGREKK